MALKIISFIFVLSLAFGIQNPSQIKDVPFDVNEVINQFSPHGFPTSNPQNLNPLLPTGEFLIDTSIVCVGAQGEQYLPAIAFDGINYLVVWTDTRSGYYNIYGTRVYQNGEVLDTAGFAISTVVTTQLNPSVSFDGTNYLVVWQDQRNSYYHDIYCTRVNQAGIVLDPAGIAISTATSWQQDPSVSFDGTNYLVVWDDWRNGVYNYDIYGARISQSGNVLDTNGIAISIPTSRQKNPAIAFDGFNYMVVWEDNRNGNFDIYGARITLEGNVLEPNGFVISNAPDSQQTPTVAFDGINYLVAWMDRRSGSNYDIFCSRITPASLVLDTNGIQVSTEINDQNFPYVGFDGTNHLIVWQDFREAYPAIYGTRITRDGIILDTNGILISNSINNPEALPSIANAGVNYLIVWRDERRGDPDIFGARMDQNGIVLDTNGLIISTAANTQSNPAIAFDGTNYLVVWEDNRNDFSDIYGSLIDQHGNILIPASIPISIAQDRQLNPAIAFDGTNYLVVWEDFRIGTNCDIYGARVSQDGIVLDTGGIGISTTPDNQAAPCVAFDGSNYLVVRQTNEGRNLYCVRVNQQGIVIDTVDIYITQGTKSSVAFDGTNYLVVFQRNNVPPGHNDIYGALLNQQGIVLNSFWITLAWFYQQQPSVTFGGTNYLVAWEDNRNETFDIYGTRVNRQGSVLSLISISTWGGDQYDPAVASDGVNYMVVWPDGRSGIDGDIYGAKINQSGYVIGRYHISAQPGGQGSPALAHGIGEEFLITYAGWTDSINHHAVNTNRIWGKFASSCSIGIKEENSKVKMQSANLLEVYPNPAKGVVRVRGPLTVKEIIEEIKIFDVAGKVVREIATPSARNDKLGEIRISLKGINPGIYFLRLGKETKKFLVVK